MKGIELIGRERIDDLLTHDLRIIQSDEVFSFSMDAVLLARFCSVPAKGKVLDLCTGNGVIPLLLSTRTQAHIEGVEIQDRLFQMAVRSVKLNGLESRITIHHGDVKDIHQKLGYGRYDAVTVNPPYLKDVGYQKNLNEYVALARHEIACTLEDVVAACARLVKSGGKVAFVHRSTRLVDLIDLLRQYRLEPKRIRFVHPRQTEEANMVLVEAIRDGGMEVRVLPPLIVYTADGTYCQELLDIYYGS